ncbi:hypothetical protein ABTX81_22785 [Kitasatospora sp. NPDC097605]|uniref:hypothetical protein n=1 Tax=Kitasatospora sp. NPDC097605 TaxID=3157226 RepID=UPI003317557A
MTDTAPAPEGDFDRRLLLQDELRPSVQTGTYEVTVTAAVSGDGVSDNLPPAVHKLTVAGPRFALDTTAVDRVHPPPGGYGDHRRTLAHLSLTDPTLPWQRHAKAHDEQDRTPWLALLVVTDHEAPVHQDTGRATVRRTVTDFLAQCRNPPAKTLLPDLGEEEIPAGLTHCQTLDVAADVFTDLAPRLEEAGDLVFVRRVFENTDRTWADGTRTPAETAEQARAVVLSARLPATPGPYSAHLVSLEGLGDHLHGSWPLRRDGQEVDTVRLLSLYSWSFQHAPDAKGSFQDALTDLVAGSGKDLLLRLPVPGGAAPQTADTPVGAAARRRLGAGYVPVTHRLPTGERTFAWYRGPFTPVAPAPPARKPEELTGETDALAYDQDHGVFDVSHASAFALGRFLTLSDPALNQALSVLRKDAQNTLHTALSQGAAYEVLARARTAAPAAGPGGPVRVAGHLRATGGARHAFEALLAAPRTAPAGADGVRTAPDTRGALRDAAGTPEATTLAELVAQVVDLHTTTLDDHLSARRLLAALPLDHLVPDRRMLPPESVRFFAVDADWLAVMLAGAVRMGQATSLDRSVTTQLLTSLLANAVLPSCGMLVRSRVVRDWPSLFVEAVAGTPATSVLHSPPRRPAPDLLLACFTGTPGQVVLRRPAEQPHYGLDGADTIDLRDLANAGTLGKAGGGTLTGVGALRRTGCTSEQPTEVLTVLTTGTNPGPCLNRSLRDALADNGMWYTDAPGKDRAELTSAELGLQLLDTAPRLLFTRPGFTDKPTPAAEEAAS